jgi:biotin transport system substrate-specific component
MSSTSASSKPTVSSQRISTQNLVLVGMFAAVMAVISQISLLMPTGVPITIQVFGVALIGTVLGWKLGGLATIVYILLGAIGLPVFSSFRGGIQVLAGMTGGYILAWPVMAVLSGIHPKCSSPKVSFAISIVLSLIGLMVVETVGGLQWAILSEQKTFTAIMAYSFVAFIPKDMVITILGVIVGNQIRKPLAKTGSLK